MERYHSVEQLDLYINHSALKEGAIKVIKRVKPQWKESDIKIKVFTDGITNRLLGGYLINDRDNMVLIRVYGEKTELFIDRSIEVRNMRTMHKAGLTPPLYCTFENGVCYGFASGEVLDQTMVRDPFISRLISEMVAKMHTLRPMAKRRIHDNLFEHPEPSLFRGLRKYLDLMPRAFNDAQIDERFRKYVPKKEVLMSEIESLETHLKLLKSPVVFCHNDLLLKNIIYNRFKKSITFIDFEYGDYNYQAFDIGNHFCEFAGVDTYNPSLYPGKEFQMRWLKNYLESYYSLTRHNGINENGLSVENGMGNGIGYKLIDKDVEVLYVEVNKFSLASHLYWGLWALIQAAHSSINFDFLGYSIQRLNEYFSRRDEIFAYEIPKDVKKSH